MTESNDNRSKRRIDPLPKDDDRDVDAIREQLRALHEERQAELSSPKPPERLIDTFWRQHGHKADQQGAWHVFYAGLNTQQKQQLWNEYHQIVAHSGEAAPSTTVDQTPRNTSNDTEVPSKFGAFQTPGSPATEKSEPRSTPARSSVADTKQKLLDKLGKGKGTKEKLKYHAKPFISAAVVMGFVLALQYNQLVIAQIRQYISPGDSLQSPTIIDPNTDIAVGDEARIIIPKINVDVPVVYDVTSYDEDEIQAGLERGVVHYGNTALPGQAGNNVIVGHSSNNFLNSGKYKFAFVLLSRLEVGDTFILHYEGTRYVYKVTNKQIIDPTDFSLVQPTAVPTTTLITCDPPGTNWRRMVIQGEQISPDPTSEPPAETSITPPVETTIVPGNSPSLFERFMNFVSGLFGDET